ncbi:MAG: PmoA family protein [Planctomycetota bacterium]
MERKLIVLAGPHDCINAPVMLDVPGAEGDVELTDCSKNKTVACQASGGKVYFIEEKLLAGTQKGYVLRTNIGSTKRAARVKLNMVENERVDILISGKLFSSYQFAAKWARPFLHPVMGPNDKPITRAYPVLQGIEGETQDHPHHKSFYVAWGDVNGANVWSETEGHGCMVHKEFLAVKEGPVYGEIIARNDWVDNQGKKLLEEIRTVRVYATPAKCRFVDLGVALRMTEGKVRFGDTKEGGICSIRVASSMDEKAGKGGIIVNSYGGTGEKETWGKRAHWCDYSGPVDGETVGIAIFDNPNNFRYPTYWHVRSYGLMTANPFGLSHFEPGRGRDGSLEVEAGERLEFNYRVYFHSGDAAKGKVADRFLNYVAPPTVNVQEQ